MFDSFKYWESRYKIDPRFKDYEINIKKKAIWINEFIKINHIKRMFDYGCGDGRQAKLFKIENYFGVDISKTAIRRCEKNNPKKSFYLTQKNDLKLTGLIKEFNSDFALSSWTISHLIEDEFFIEYMNNLFLSSRLIVINSLNQNKRYSGLYQKDRHFTKHIEKNFINWKLKEQKGRTYIYEKK